MFVLKNGFAQFPEVFVGKDHLRERGENLAVMPDKDRDLSNVFIAEHGHGLGDIAGINRGKISGREFPCDFIQMVLLEIQE